MSLIFDGGSSGGGSGGQTIQYSTMPDVIDGAIIQYTGENTDNYTKGFFYRGASFEAQASATVSVGTDLPNLMVDADTFGTKMEELLGEPLESTAYMFQYVVDEWLYNGDTNLDGTIQDYGITFDEPVPILDIYITVGTGNAFITDQEKWKTEVPDAGSYEFVYDGSIGSWTFEGNDVNLADYGIEYDSGMAPNLSVSQTVGSGLQISIPMPYTFYDKAEGEGGTGNYTFVYDGLVWNVLNEAIDTQELFLTWGIEVIGEPQNNDTFVVAYSGLISGPIGSETIQVDSSPGLEDGTEILVGYEPALSTWLQINVQPTLEVATSETPDGNVELSAEYGVVVVETPTGLENKQVANVEFVNNLVGDVASILSEL